MPVVEVTEIVFSGLKYQDKFALLASLGTYVQISLKSVSETAPRSQILIFLPLRITYFQDVFVPSHHNDHAG